MQIILTESLIILGLLVLNGVFAMSELAVVTSRRSRLERLASNGASGAKQALALVDEPTRFLSTVQVGITLIGVLAGAFGGATIAEELAIAFATLPVIGPYAESVALGVVVLVVSFFSLVIGELVPKRIAMQAPERVATIIAMPMQALSRIGAPLVWVLTTTTKTILTLLRVPETKGTRVTEDEIRAMMAEGRQSGAVQVAEHDMLEGVFRLGDRFARDLMVPRPDVDWLDVTDAPAVVRERLARPRAEVLLLCRGSIDEVVGFVRPSRVLSTALAGGAIDLEAHAETALFVPGSMSTIRLLEYFKQSRQRYAVVLDEYGGVEGLVSLDEVLEEIVGEVPESAGETDAMMVQRADGTWLADGSTELAEVVERFKLPQPPDRERGSYRTLAGFVMARLGRVPRATDHFVYAGYRFEVIDMDERRVDKVLVTPPASPPVTPPVTPPANRSGTAASP